MGDEITKQRAPDPGENEESSWVLDSVVGFLKGPIWNIPILTFIEQRSVVFEPDDTVEESEVLTREYRAIYEEYKNLVDRLLSGHMSDLGISAEQFDEACVKAEGTLTSKFRAALFEQIWASNDFDIFVRMMTQRNIELQLQALEVLAQRYGLVYDSFIPQGAKREDYLRDDDDIMAEVLKRSLQEQESQEGEPTTMRSSSPPSKHQQEMAILQERARLEEKLMSEKEKEDDLLSRAFKDNVDVKESSGNNNSSKNNLSKPLPVIGNSFKAPPTPQSSLAESTSPGHQPQSQSGPGGISAEEIRKRQEYLRQQRDKLLSIKKKEREKQIEKMGEEEILAKRPKSARAVRSVVKKKEEGGENEEDSDEDEGSSNLAFRKSLAARLKAEVVEEKQKQAD